MTQKKKKRERAKPSPTHYIDNKRFFEEISVWKKGVVDAENSGDPPPPVTEYIGKCFLDIAEHLSYRPNFINYPYREEMVSDGIENCLMYASNFDPSKSNNPFSYFTQIIYYAFLRRIQKEKKQSYVKYKSLELAEMDSRTPKWLKDEIFRENIKEQCIKNLSLTDNDLEKFEPKKKKKKRKAQSKKVLDLFMEEE